MIRGVTAKNVRLPSTSDRVISYWIFDLLPDFAANLTRPIVDLRLISPNRDLGPPRPDASVYILEILLQFGSCPRYILHQAHTGWCRCRYRDRCMCRYRHKYRYRNRDRDKARAQGTGTVTGAGLSLIHI